MRGSNACYSCSEPGHMMKDCPYTRGREKGKEKVQPNGPSEEVLGGNDSSHSSLGVKGKTPLVISRVRSLNYFFMCMVLCTSMKLICWGHHVGC